ncbi:N-6 DNA methylase [Gordonia hongkongensis]|uniref:site-specific DNA-methyltransferase (adenine-specific) n=1 Tax=Gordonia hongkongensis TaxID=1701090 RepID=A0AAX3T1X6_9ACTN|nr:N-6 DNA methylase [Gordonia hongkongensis]WFP22921.1 N-6 DNA methylase [Gordonia hongkongensis]
MPPRTTTDVKRHGKHYTPELLATFLAQRVVGQVVAHMSGRGEGSTLRFLDPACGDGELLFAVQRVASRLLPGARLALVGYDLDHVAIGVAQARADALGVTVELHQGDFLQARRDIPEGTFDAVITNPPYVRTQHLGQSTAQTLATEFGLTGRIDLTHPFVTVVPPLLRSEGVLGLLCSNRFLSTKSGINVRKVLQTLLDPVELYDLGDTKLFTAAVLPAIVIALNRHTRETTNCTFVSAYETGSEVSVDSTATLYEALVAGRDDVIAHDDRIVAVRSGALMRAASTDEPWRLAHSSSDAWLRRIESSTWRTFGEVAKIRVGIKTTADRVFISDDWHSTTPKPEDELLHPLITHDNLTPWRISEQLSTRVLYPYDTSAEKRTLLDMDRFPSAMAYFESHSERLRGRKYVVEGGREWFEIWVPQKPKMWAVPKIVFPDISVDARFALDRSGAVVNGDCYWISLADVTSDDIAYLMLAVANSKLGLRFYDEVCGNKLYSGRRRWMTQYVGRLPLPDPETTAARHLISATRDLVESKGAADPHKIQLLDDLVESAFMEPIVRLEQHHETLF